MAKRAGERGNGQRDDVAEQGRVDKLGGERVTGPSGEPTKLEPNPAEGGAGEAARSNTPVEPVPKPSAPCAEPPQSAEAGGGAAEPDAPAAEPRAADEKGDGASLPGSPEAETTNAGARVDEAPHVEVRAVVPGDDEEQGEDDRDEEREDTQDEEREDTQGEEREDTQDEEREDDGAAPRGEGTSRKAAPVGRRPALRESHPVPAGSSIARGERRARRRRLGQRAGLVAILLVLLAVGGVTLLPVWSLERTERDASACFDSVVRTGEGEPAECVPKGWQVGLPARLPWLAVETEAMRSGFELRAAVMAYDRASALRPNRPARDATAQRLLELAYGLTPPSGSEGAVALVPGAFATISRFGAERDEKAVRTRAFQTARAVAALPLLRQLAPRGDENEPWLLNVERGAMLCLLDDASAGMESLRAADRSYRASSEHGDGLDPARLSMLACEALGAVDEPPAEGSEVTDVDPRLVRPASMPLKIALEASANAPGAVEQALRLLSNGDSPLAPHERLRLLPWAMRALERPKLADVLALAWPDEGLAAAADRGQAPSPWALLDRRSRSSLLGVDPAALQSLATDVEAMLRNLPDPLEEPVACSSHGCAADHARRAPGPALAKLARELWFECAAEWARRGDRDQTIAAVTRYRAIGAPAAAPELAPVLLAVRSADGALEALERKASAGTDPASAAVRATGFEAEVTRALALGHLSRFQEAFEAAERAWASANADAKRKEADRPTDASGQPGDPPSDDPTASGHASRIAAAAWLLAATSLHVEREQQVLSLLPPPPTVEPGKAPELETQLDEVALWLTLASADAASEPRRRTERWRLELRATHDRVVTWVLPAVIDVAGRAVPESSDVEIWLDRVLDGDHRIQPALTARARAEAARWRSDGLAAVEWETRAAVLLGLGEGVAGSLLAHFAALR